VCAEEQASGLLVRERRRRRGCAAQQLQVVGAAQSLLFYLLRRLHAVPDTHTHTRTRVISNAMNRRSSSQRTSFRTTMCASPHVMSCSAVLQQHARLYSLLPSAETAASTRHRRSGCVARGRAVFPSFLHPEGAHVGPAIHISDPIQSSTPRF